MRRPPHCYQRSARPPAARLPFFVFALAAAKADPNSAHTSTTKIFSVVGGPLSPVRRLFGRRGVRFCLQTFPVARDFPVRFRHAIAAFPLKRPSNRTRFRKSPAVLQSGVEETLQPTIAFKNRPQEERGLVRDRRFFFFAATEAQMLTKSQAACRPLERASVWTSRGATFRKAGLPSNRENSRADYSLANKSRTASAQKTPNRSLFSQSLPRCRHPRCGRRAKSGTTENCAVSARLRSARFLKRIPSFPFEAAHRHFGS